MAQPSKIERVMVLGAGAIGGALGALLHDRGVPVILIARGEHAARIRGQGLTLQMPGEELHVTPRVEESVSEVDWQTGDLVVLSTKLQDAESALDALLNAAGPEVPVACAVNGLHGERWATRRFRTVLSTLVWVVATHLVPGEVRIYSPELRGILDTGAVLGDPGHGLTRELCGLFELAGFEAVPRLDIQRWKMSKLLLNLGGAAQALVTDDWQEVAKRARAEGLAVLESAQVDFVPLAEFMARVESVSMEEIDGEARGGGSTWQSFQRGQPLESRWLEGALADLAEEQGLQAPINRALDRFARQPRPLLAAEVFAAAD